MLYLINVGSNMMLRSKSECWRIFCFFGMANLMERKNIVIIASHGVCSLQTMNMLKRVLYLKAVLCLNLKYYFDTWLYVQLIIDAIGYISFILECVEKKTKFKIVCFNSLKTFLVGFVFKMIKNNVKNS